MTEQHNIEWKEIRLPFIEKENLSNQGLNERQIKAVLYAKNNAYITNSIYQDLCRTSERTALRDLAFLTEQNILIKPRKERN